ncbi:MAG TPA: hypothetical protein H9870_12790 [Candidatus Corynebacterium avicola]|uniref:YtxH domain-containing protein n=1 Tax=Candidatus Corynebacterium avicola TaxID=2838527 RepID=A0A9D1UMZ8_9CORY|nr:hypothetical protein [Candidatus Corynebacterium avicola]
MIQLVIGAAAGYVFGTKAGRRRYEQIRRGYAATINSPVTRRAVQAGRKALADKLDPEPRMRELRDVRATDRHGEIDGSQDAYLENDDLEFEEDIIVESDQPRMRDSKGRRVDDQDGSGGSSRRRFGRR